MILIWGIRRAVKTLGQITCPCPRCRKHVVHTAFVQKSKFTLFFIPLIPLSSQYGIACGLCGLRLNATANLRQQLKDWDRTGQLAVVHA